MPFEEPKFEVEQTNSIPDDSSKEDVFCAGNFLLKKYPENFKRLSGLKSAEGLNLPESIGGKVYLNSLPIDDKEGLIKNYPNLIIK